MTLLCPAPRFPRRPGRLATLVLLVLAGCAPESPSPAPSSPAVTSQAAGSPGPASPGPVQDSPPADSAAPAAPENAEPAPASGGKTAAPFVPPLSAEELADGWIALFDGQSLFGWQAVTKADWEVRDGVIQVASGEPGLLCTSVQFSDYVLEADFRFAPQTNSGIFLHSPLKPTDPKSDCYELNIAEPSVSPFPTGSFVGRAKATADAAPDTWHHYRVTVHADRVVVELNGQPVLDYTDPQPLRRGYIGLQLNKGKVEFRNLKLKPLGLMPLFNGQDLGGWTAGPGTASKFTVEEPGVLRVRGGKGQLETKAHFADFVVQFECQTHAPGLNSGLFFRCIPGQEMQGYESQIHNGFQQGDRTKPVDCGTGGIFRRQNARLVAADDLQWFTETLVADGPRIAVWVNGYPVTAWIDDRPPDENPRKGLRTAAGSLMLQGHDPTTDLSFRNLRAGEMTPRRANGE